MPALSLQEISKWIISSASSSINKLGFTPNSILLTATRNGRLIFCRKVITRTSLWLSSVLASRTTRANAAVEITPIIVFFLFWSKSVSSSIIAKSVTISGLPDTSWTFLLIKSDVVQWDGSMLAIELINNDLPTFFLPIIAMWSFFASPGFIFYSLILFSSNCI